MPNESNINSNEMKTPSDHVSEVPACTYHIMAAWASSCLSSSSPLLA